MEIKMSTVSKLSIEQIIDQMKKLIDNAEDIINELKLEIEKKDNEIECLKDEIDSSAF
jgi:SMC interacting uncharacterized protein involved in chromosome segregation